MYATVPEKIKTTVRARVARQEKSTLLMHSLKHFGRGKRN
jgi:hypothetical protein